MVDSATIFGSTIGLIITLSIITLVGRYKKNSINMSSEAFNTRKNNSLFSMSIFLLIILIISLSLVTTNYVYVLLDNKSKEYRADKSYIISSLIYFLYISFFIMTFIELLFAFKKNFSLLKRYRLLYYFGISGVIITQFLFISVPLLTQDKTARYKNNQRARPLLYSLFSERRLSSEDFKIRATENGVSENFLKTDKFITYFSLVISFILIIYWFKLLVSFEMKKN